MIKEYTGISGIKTAYTMEGDGNQSVLVLHGWGTNVETMQGVINILKEKYTVYAYDAPGFGDSEDPKEVWGTEEYADFALAFMEKMGLDRPHLIGHSFGGKTISVIAGRGEPTGKLVFIDASGILPKRGLTYHVKVKKFKLLKFLATKLIFWKDQEKLLEKFYRRHGSDDYNAAQGIMRKTFVKVVNESTEDYLPEISAESLIIWGDKDEDTPLWMGKVFEEKIKNSGLVVLNGGHYAFAEDYGTFKAVLKSFFAIGGE